jgi:hypothetical protein
VGGGVGFLAAGVALDLTWVNANAADLDEAIAHPERHSRADANGITQRFQAARWTTLGLLGVGVAGAAAGTLMEFTHLTVTPWGVGMSGRF